MAELFQEFRRFEYKSTSNLVLQREGPGPSQNEPTGEPETLKGRQLSRMGDRALSTAPKKRKIAETAVPREKRSRLDVQKGTTALDVGMDITYRPSTTHTRVVFDNILGLIQGTLSEQPRDVIIDAANEVVEVCLSEDLKDGERKAACELLIGTISDEQYNRVFRLSKELSDFRGVETTNDVGEVSGVAVVFDEEDVAEESGDDLGEEEVEMDEPGEEDWLQEAEQKHVATKKSLEEDAGEETSPEGVLDVGKIESHWLQRELCKVDPDPEQAMKLEKQILDILPTPDIHICENNLVKLLRYENFTLAKLLLKNRWRVFYCTCLGQAQTTQEKAEIYQKMRSHPEGLEVLSALENIRLRRNKPLEHTRNVRREAQTLVDRHAPKIDDADADEGMVPIAGVVEESRQLQYVDVEELSFAQGSNLMTNKRVELPEGSQRIESKSWDEVIVQPPTSEPPAGTRIPVSSLPEWAQPAFTLIGVERLNAVQSKVFHCAFHEGSRNMLICAPTGAGKTNVAMLAMLNVLSQHLLSDGTIDKNAFKMVYISPMRALVQEQVLSFGKRFAPFGLTVRELTGEVSLTRQQLDETQLIVTTPEKWDIITRKAGEKTVTQLVKLVIIDEIHLLHDSRGPVIEALVARILRRAEWSREKVRLVGLSATLPNYEDVALFLRVPMAPESERGLFVFGREYRPVPLEQSYIGIKEKKAVKRLAAMNEVLYEKVMQGAGMKQIIVFVHSRKDTVKTAKTLRDMALKAEVLGKFLEEDSASRQILQTEADSIKSKELKDLLPFGFAIHHAGLARTDRSLVEDLFADRHIQVLVSTATLAWGVNLPAQTVIIKGTQVYLPEKGCWSELSPLDVMQMMGRAGRPQYDTSGRGIIITQHSELQFYLSVNNQQLPIESQLISQLPDLINAEVVAGTIRSRDDAAHWMSSTYLYIRMIRNPELYGVSREILEEDPKLEGRRLDLAHSTLLLLDRNKLLRYDKRIGSIVSTALGRVASHYYLKFHSIATFNQLLTPTTSDIDLLRAFALSSEFKAIPVRHEEKVELIKLMDRVPIPVKGAIDDPATKVTVLLQAYLSRLKLEGFALASDMVYVQQSAARIMRAIFEIALRRGWAALALRALQFCKMVDRRMWATATPLRQFSSVSEELCRKLEKRDFSWERLFDLTPVELGELVRLPKMGKTLHRLVHQVPKVDVSAFVQPITRTCLAMEVTITPDFQWDAKVLSTSEGFWLLVEDADGEQILYHEFFTISEHTAKRDILMSFSVPISPEPLPPTYFIRVVSDRWVNSETLLPVSFKHLILPEKSPPATDLLDLQPLPTASLNLPAEVHSQLFHFSHFNPLQTQTFSALFNSDSNALICAPPAAGKSTAAEFAILRLVKNGTRSEVRVAYVAPNPLVVKATFDRWTQTIGKALGLRVSLLTGEVSTDLTLANESNILVATPEHWDYFSRRWRTRKSIQSIRLFIADDIHLVDSSPALEVCVSRMRYISAQVSVPIRMLALSVSLSNSRDFAEWIGAPPSAFFAFGPHVRPTPLEVVVHGIDIHHRPSRLQAMSLPSYQSINQYSKNQPVLIFTGDRRQARVSALDLLLHAAAEGAPDRFLQTSVETIEAEISLTKCRDRALVETLKRGVGVLHEGLTEPERALVIRLHSTGAIQVCVVTAFLVWGLSLSSRLVVIQDTERFEGRESRWTSYAMADILEMMARASTQNRVGGGIALIFAPACRKEHLKRFAFEPIAVESSLDNALADNIAAEVVLKTIENKQDAVDWLTWTLFYRRLSKNPNYYGMQTVSHQQLCDHLSELVETTVETLAQSQCISVGEDEVSLSVLNLGLISSFYYIKTSTIELFNRSVTAGSKRRGILEILSAAAEFENVPMRSGEEDVLASLANNLGLAISDASKLTDPHFKVLTLLSSHFVRAPLTSDMAFDQKHIVGDSTRLIDAIVDVIASNGWLRPALAAMEVAQSIVQALPPGSSPLLQLPFFDLSLVKKCNASKVMDFFDLMNCEDDARSELLKDFSIEQMSQIANACNRYPILIASFDVLDGSRISSGKVDDDQPDVFSVDAGRPVTVAVAIEREMGDEAVVGPVVANFFPRPKDEQWWVVVGRVDTNSLLAIKRITPKEATCKSKLEFECPTSTCDLTIYLVCDSYVGCDQEYKLQLVVQ